MLQPFAAVLVSAAFLLSGAPAARAQELPPADPRIVLNLITENDSYGLDGTDRWYTNGLRLGWQSGEDALPGPVAWLDQRLADLFGPARTRWGLAVSQSIFTPVNKQLSTPDPRDRPYAGLLYAEIGLNRRTADRLDRFALQVGLVGPSALGRQAQDFVHSILGASQPRGWGAQLPDEPQVNLLWDRTWRMPLPVPGMTEAPGFDLLPNLALALGTGQIHAGAGARLRFGQGLSEDFGPPRIRPALAPAPAPAGEEFGWYVFAGANGRVVGRDVTLNGTLWRSSPSVDPRHLVGELELGAAAFWRGIRLSFTHVWRSKEFVAQTAPFRFGSISVSVAF